MLGIMRRLPDAGRDHLGTRWIRLRAQPRSGPDADQDRLRGRQAVGAAHVAGAGIRARVRDPPGVATLEGEAEPFLDGCRVGPVWGTMWHGTLENDGFRRAWMTEIEGQRDRPGVRIGRAAYGARRETMINTLPTPWDPPGSGSAAGRIRLGPTVTVRAYRDRDRQREPRPAEPARRSPR